MEKTDFNKTEKQELSLMLSGTETPEEIAEKLKKELASAHPIVKASAAIGISVTQGYKNPWEAPYLEAAIDFFADLVERVPEETLAWILAAMVDKGIERNGINGFSATSFFLFLMELDAEKGTGFSSPERRISNIEDVANQVIEIIQKTERKRVETLAVFLFPWSFFAFKIEAKS